MGDKTIRVSEKTWRKLRARKRGDESFESVIRRELEDDDPLAGFGAWSDTSLTQALADAEAARVRMETLDYQRTGGIQFLRDENFVGVTTTYRLVAGFDTIT